MNQDKLLSKMRNVGIIAHIDAGKTTTTEGILYRTGKKHKIGAVHDGEATMDWMQQERERGITITSAATTCFWQDCQINIIDTPGHIDFTVEVERSLRVLDGAVVVFDGKMGVEAQTETVWRQANKYKIPRVCFINKINQTGGDFNKSLKSIHSHLSKKAYPIHLPIGFEQSIKGVIDLISMKAYTYDDFSDKELKVSDIPSNMLKQAQEARLALIENAVAEDEQILNKYLEEGIDSLAEQDIKQAIRTAVLTGEFFITTGGDGRGVIVEKILDLIVDFLPSPMDYPTIAGIHPKTSEAIVRKTQTDQPLSALAFKIATDPFVGKLCFVRVYSGVLKAGSYIFNASTGEKLRAGRLVRMFADKREDIDELQAGDIGAIVGLKDTFTGHSLSDVNQSILLESIEFAEPPVSIAIEPATKADQEKMSLALQRLAEEDPTFRVSVDHETNQTIISGMGELHLEIIVDRMKREFKVEANVGKPQVAYRETIKKFAEAQGKYIRQSGGRGQYGDVWLKLEVQQPGDGFEFVNQIKGGVVPQEYIPAVKNGVTEAMNRGVVAGYPVVDIKVTLYDGSYHDVDSSEAAFKIAASIAFQEAAKLAEPILLEPIMKLEVVTPEEFMGDVIGDINSRRGKIEAMEDKLGAKIVSAFVPLSSMFGYTNDLRSMTQGRAASTMELYNYQEVPSSIAEEISSSKNKK